MIFTTTAVRHQAKCQKNLLFLFSVKIAEAELLSKAGFNEPGGLLIQALNTYLKKKKNH